MNEITYPHETFLSSLGFKKLSVKNREKWMLRLPSCKYYVSISHDFNNSFSRKYHPPKKYDKIECYITRQYDNGHEDYIYGGYNFFGDIQFATKLFAMLRIEERIQGEVMRNFTSPDTAHKSQAETC